MFRCVCLLQKHAVSFYGNNIHFLLLNNLFIFTWMFGCLLFFSAKHTWLFCQSVQKAIRLLRQTCQTEPRMLEASSIKEDSFMRLWLMSGPQVQDPASAVWTDT